MKKFYESVVKYDKLSDEGEIVNVTEQYLLHAVSVTDAEKSLIADIAPSIKGECEVISARKSKYIEFVAENHAISMVDAEVRKMMNQNSRASDVADKYFAAKVSFITTSDDRKAKQKKTAYYYIIHATSVDAANDTLVEFLKESLGDWDINSVTETKIVDVLLQE